uniref:Reverse transcriptase domain-containing protein n=1 Tax=Strigamia maritima TaxID=126957 RepID=T1IT53_STRMM
MSITSTHEGTVQEIIFLCLMRELRIGISEKVGKRWEQLNTGGSGMGLRKIFCLKFADDIAVIAKTIDGLQDMIKGLETYITNTQMSQIIVFCSGGRLGKQESWIYLGQKLMMLESDQAYGYGEHKGEVENLFSPGAVGTIVWGRDLGAYWERCGREGTPQIFQNGLASVL